MRRSRDKTCLGRECELHFRVEAGVNLDAGRHRGPVPCDAAGGTPGFVNPDAARSPARAMGTQRPRVEFL